MIVVTLIATRCLFGEVRSKMLGEVPTLLRELNDSMRLITIVFPYLPIPAHRRRDRACQRLGEIITEPEPTRAASNRSGKARSRLSSSRRRHRGEGTEGARTPPPSRRVRAWQGGNGESEDAVVVTPRRGLVGRGRGERGRCRRAASGPGREGTGRARTLPPSRTQLHRFSFPNLSWGNHRLLRCSKNPASSPPPAASDTPSPDKEKTAHSSTDGVGVGSLPQRGPQRPWNLRTYRSATAAPCPEGLDDAADAALE
uniref:Uncharacterized protein n=1 Tax=Oryza barthii TaxID=65489 RepID=A0A0D3GSI9_9ORYZ